MKSFDNQKFFWGIFVISLISISLVGYYSPIHQSLEYHHFSEQRTILGIPHFGDVITNLFFGVMLTDMETCYKLLPGDFVRKLDIKSDRFDFEPEITAKVLKAGLRIKEVPITYKGRSFTEGKKITWRDGIAALYTLIKLRFVD